MKSQRFAGDAGTSIVEFALVLPAFVFLLVGTIEFGRFGYFSILAANAARAGAAYGAQNLITADDDGGIQNAALQDGANLSNWTSNPPQTGIFVNQLCSVDGGAPTTCSTQSQTGPPQNTVYYVQVKVTGLFSPILNYPGIPSQIYISGSSTMRVAEQ